MANGIILRVQEGTILPTELTNTLSTLLPGYQVEYFKEQADYQRSIKRRIDSLHSAFLFIIDAYPPSPQVTHILPDTLKQYADDCRDECVLTKATLEELQQELEKFTVKLIESLVVAWDWSSPDKNSEAINALNEAEQYMLMSQGRPDLATIIPMDFGSNKPEYFLQLEESIPPYYDFLLNELQELKKQNFPKTPAWYKGLPEYQQAYFCNINPKAAGLKTLYHELQSFVKSWENMKSVSSPHLVLNHIKNNTGWFIPLSPQLKAMLKILSEKPGEMDKNLNDLKKMLSSNINNNEFELSVMQVKKLPEWYWGLPETQQYFLEYVLKNTDTIEQAISFLPSRLRTIPAPANLARHRSFQLDSNGNYTELSPPKKRSSHIASRDVRSMSKAIQERHALSNFEKVTEEAKSDQKILMQTLVSPINAKDWVPDFMTRWLPELPPDLELYEQAREAVSKSSHAGNTFQHNHPYNITRYVAYTASKNKDSLKLLREAAKNAPNNPEVQELLAIYKNVLESPVGTATIWDYDGRELFLSSLEQMIVLFGFEKEGFSYGSCVSGKDRKAIELIHSDAMLIYKKRSGSWPKFGDPKEKKERIAFVDIVVDLYCSRHQHEHAGQNAPGSEGIKTPDWYFPKDIVEAINKRLANDKAIEHDDRLASNNEVKYIDKKGKSKLVNENALLCKLIATQLGEKNCTSLYESLYNFVNERSRFQSLVKDTWYLKSFFKKETTSEATKETYKLPAGIGAILDIMADENSGGNNVNRISLIFNVVLVRGEYGADRSIATNSVYDRIRAFFKPISNDTCDGVDNSPEQPVHYSVNGEVALQKLVDEAVAEWDKLFKASIGKSTREIKTPQEANNPFRM